jgi:hypothetical protein
MLSVVDVLVPVRHLDLRCFHLNGVKLLYQAASCLIFLRLNLCHLFLKDPVLFWQTIAQVFSFL